MNHALTGLGGVDIGVSKACKGKAREVTLSGTLTPSNQAAVLGHVRAELNCVNAALLLLNNLEWVDDARRFDVAPLVNPDAALVYVVRQDQVAMMEPHLQEGIRMGHTRLVFTTHNLPKARVWLAFCSQFEIRKQGPQRPM